MADGRDPTPAYNPDTRLRWTEIFRCFQVALDPRKLFVAAVGILVMSLAWWALSHAFYYKAPDEKASEYSEATAQKKFEGQTNPATGKPYTNDELPVAAAEEAKRRYEADLAQWKELDALAGPGGRFRTLPWYEYRGPNPFELLSRGLGGSAEDRTNALRSFLSGSVPVLIEPLVKLLLPVAKIISPGISAQTRFYLFLLLLTNVAVWAFCGGIITRLAAVQLANKGPISLKQAVRFVRKRYLGYLGAPLVPMIIIGFCVLGLIVFGLFNLIPGIGEIFVLGLGLPLVIIGGAVMAVFLVGLVGYPLMYPTLSAEGDQSDTFDALSRSVNYVYQAPWQYMWCWLVAILYGAAVTLFVVFFTCLTVYVGKWAVGLPASAVWSERKPEYMFIYAPESFGWRELLTRDSPFAVKGKWEPAEKDSTRMVYRYDWVDPTAHAQATSEDNAYWYKNWGAGIVCFWLTLIFLMMLGFTYSFFWSAATMIYFLLRKRLDEAELDEVFIEDDEPEAPPVPPRLADAPSAPAAPSTSLPVLVSPPAPPMPPAPAPVPLAPPMPPPPPPAPPPVSFSPPPPPPEPPKPSDGPPLG